MDKRISTLYVRYGEALRYLIVGGLTTLINIVLFFGLTHLGIAWFWANIAAWVLSVLFAFVANKKVVFASADMTPRTVFKEAVSFFSLRGASLLADTAILFVGLTLLHGSPIIVKIIDQVVVIGLNYVFSKHIFS
ncbi:GtrA family protein [Lacticaseibacillus camelliae]|uniref:Teichoic acid glycosylation protein n=1 Tax=Lacticaseibacillus camelliae DSM 22697 = JCM 13995 TaxID=1423730 RepID=A0A0R2F915_9LACO|nr:GtrA family protein [Lacticaseibacillus camelliae]KRN21325.1 teichoic acid glycosylation protein [Lacticaseibacillus camelliae DSM 22697 = JCM 13995]